MLTQAELEAIRKRAEAASVGWIAVDGVYVASLDDDGNEIVIAECDTEDNAYFIGEARQDIPKLLAEIERMRVGIMYAMQETYCDDTCDFLRRLLIGEEKTEIPYRMGHKYGGDSD